MSYAKLLAGSGVVRHIGLVIAVKAQGRILPGITFVNGLGMPFLLVPGRILEQSEARVVIHDVRLPVLVELERHLIGIGTRSHNRIYSFLAPAGTFSPSVNNRPIRSVDIRDMRFTLRADYQTAVAHQISLAPGLFETFAVWRARVRIHPLLRYRVFPFRLISVGKTQPASGNRIGNVRKDGPLKGDRTPATRTRAMVDGLDVPRLAVEVGVL